MLPACALAGLSLVTALIAGCGSPAPRATTSASAAIKINPIDPSKSTDVALHAMSLIDVGYVFGGGNPEAGLDCSGLVKLVYEQAAGVKLPHNAAQIAQLARPVERHALRPGDLVFFNTLNAPFSHVGVYIGDNRFIHAPRSKSAVKIESLNSRYFASRFEGARTLFAD